MKNISELEKNFYGDYLYSMEESANLVLSKIESLRENYMLKKNRDPIEHCKARIKKTSSVQQKLKKRNLPITLESALNNITDAVGIRIICTFLDDIYLFVNMLKSQEEFEIIKDKDYIMNPKPNGYRSYHLILKVNATGERSIYVEVQIRTIAMDCWASLEHQLKYKRTIANQDIFVKELKRCSNEIAATDLSLQTLKDLIEQEN